MSKKAFQPAFASKRHCGPLRRRSAVLGVWAPRPARDARRAFCAHVALKDRND